MGEDFSKLCVALILAFIRIHQLNLKLAETCQNGVICIMCGKNDSVEKFVKLNF